MKFTVFKVYNSTALSFLTYCTNITIVSFQTSSITLKGNSISINLVTFHFPFLRPLASTHLFVSVDFFILDILY